MNANLFSQNLGQPLQQNMNLGQQQGLGQPLLGQGQQQIQTTPTLFQQQPQSAQNFPSFGSAGFNALQQQTMNPQFQGQQALQQMGQLNMQNQMNMGGQQLMGLQVGGLQGAQNPLGAQLQQMQASPQQFQQFLQQQNMIDWQSKAFQNIPQIFQEQIKQIQQNLYQDAYLLHKLDQDQKATFNNQDQNLDQLIDEYKRAANESCRSFEQVREIRDIFENIYQKGKQIAQDWKHFQDALKVNQDAYFKSPLPIMNSLYDYLSLQVIDLKNFCQKMEIIALTGQTLQENKSLQEYQLEAYKQLIDLISQINRRIQQQETQLLQIRSLSTQQDLTQTPGQFQNEIPTQFQTSLFEQSPYSYKLPVSPYQMQQDQILIQSRYFQEREKAKYGSFGKYDPLMPVINEIPETPYISQASAGRNFQTFQHDELILGKSEFKKQEPSTFFQLSVQSQFH